MNLISLKFVILLGKLGSEFFPGEKEPGFDRALKGTGCSGDLFDGEAVEIVQDDDGPLFVAQAQDLSSEDLRPLFFRISFKGLVGERFRISLEKFFHRQIFFLFFHKGEGGSGQNPVKPWAKRLGGSEFADVETTVYETILHDVPGHLPVLTKEKGRPQRLVLI